MVTRKALIDTIQELRTLIQQENWEQAQPRIPLLVGECDRLTKPIYSPARGAEHDPPIYAAEQIGFRVPLVRSLRGYISEAGFALTQFDSRLAVFALDQALRELDEEPTALGK